MTLLCGGLRTVAGVAAGTNSQEVCRQFVGCLLTTSFAPECFSFLLARGFLTAVFALQMLMLAVTLTKVGSSLQALEEEKP